MFRTENSPEYEAKMEEWRKKDAAKAKRASDALKKARGKWKASDSGWLPMHECPFRALDEKYGYEATILVSDGEQVAVARVKRRFGTPVFWKTEPEYVMRDGMMCLVGGEEDPRDDLPKWWWKWEITDELASETWAYGEPAGQPEIRFVPTLWSFMPEAPNP